MKKQERAKWERVRTRGRADFALRYGGCLGVAFWCVQFVFGEWSGGRDIIMRLPFMICGMVAIHWFIFWPWMEWGYRRSIEKPVDSVPNDGPPMRWPKEMLEDFFGEPCRWVEPFHEIQFHAHGMSYRLMFDPNRDFLWINGDPNTTETSFPAIEIQCTCKRIEVSETSNADPLLFFYASEDKNRERLRFVITRTKDRRFSISPHWGDF